MTISDIASMIVALATTGSLLYISRQVNINRQQAKGQFLMALDAQIEKSTEIVLRLFNEQTFKPEGLEWGKIWRFMSIFERINIMVEDRILDIALVDRLYGFMLLGLIANDDIYERVKATGAEWQDFIDLCYAIADHRQCDGIIERDAAFIERVHKLSKQASTRRNPWRF